MLTSAGVGKATPAAARHRRSGGALDALVAERARPWWRRQRRAIGLRKQKIGTVETGRGAQSLLSGDNTFIEYAVWLCRTWAYACSLIAAARANLTLPIIPANATA